MYSFTRNPETGILEPSGVPLTREVLSLDVAIQLLEKNPEEFKRKLELGEIDFPEEAQGTPTPRTKKKATWEERNDEPERPEDIDQAYRSMTPDEFQRHFGKLAHSESAMTKELIIRPEPYSAARHETLILLKPHGETFYSRDITVIGKRMDNIVNYIEECQRQGGELQNAVNMLPRLHSKPRSVEYADALEGLFVPMYSRLDYIKGAESMKNLYRITISWLLEGKTFTMTVTDNSEKSPLLKMKKEGYRSLDTIMKEAKDLHRIFTAHTLGTTYEGDFIPVPETIKPFYIDGTMQFVMSLDQRPANLEHDPKRVVSKTGYC